MLLRSEKKTLLRGHHIRLEHNPNKAIDASLSIVAENALIFCISLFIDHTLFIFLETHRSDEHTEPKRVSLQDRKADQKKYLYL